MSQRAFSGTILCDYTLNRVVTRSVSASLHVLSVMSRWPVQGQTSAPVDAVMNDGWIVLVPVFVCFDTIVQNAQLTYVREITWRLSFRLVTTWTDLFFHRAEPARAPAFFRSVWQRCLRRGPSLHKALAGKRVNNISTFGHTGSNPHTCAKKQT